MVIICLHFKSLLSIILIIKSASLVIDYVCDKHKIYKYNMTGVVAKIEYAYPSVTCICFHLCLKLFFQVIMLIIFHISLFNPWKY